MMRLTILVAFLAALGPALAEDDCDLPVNIRVIAEFIEVPHPLVTELMTCGPADSGPKLHARVREHVRTGRARILETAIITTRPNQRASTESFCEYLSPAESFPYVGCGLGAPFVPPVTVEPEPLPVDPNSIRLHWPPYFQTHNVGVILEVEPSLNANHKIIDLRMLPELRNVLRLETWFHYQDDWGHAPIRKPVVETLTMNVGVTVLDGTFALVGAHTPTRKSGGPDTSKKILLFVRADIIPVGS